MCRIEHMYYSVKPKTADVNTTGIGESGTKIREAVPIVVVRRTLMKAKESKQTRIDQLERGNWLYDLLVDARKDVAQKPSAAAIDRIRARLNDEMDERSAQAAA